MCELHHHNEFGLFNLVEWLVACDDPFCKELLESFLVPWPLLNMSLVASNSYKENINVHQPGLTGLQMLS